MNEETSRSKKRAGRAGPQGTQVFSRDQIADFLDDGDTRAEERERPSLVLLTDHRDGRQPGQVFPLASDRLTIGRSKVCDLCIEEPSMSSEHARLVYSDDAWRVINLLSTNGVFVNDEKVFSHRLHDGDEIRLGRTRLRFRDPTGGHAGQYGTSSGMSAVIRWAPWVIVPIALAALAFWVLR